MTDRELAACPFCGGQGYWRQGRCEPSFYVACKACEAIGPVTVTLDTAIAAWNRRAPGGEDARDAGRYRWLRENQGARSEDGTGILIVTDVPSRVPRYIGPMISATLDAAIDAAIAAASGGTNG